MARKAVVSGGKRDELVDAALKLFLERGYEATSVRAVLEAVHGEVGMFYHYFKSKDEIFDAAVARYLEGYAARFRDLSLESGSLREKYARVMGLVGDTLLQYGGMASGKLHWSVALALHERTLAAMLPAVETLVDAALEAGGRLPDGADAKGTAAFLLYGVGGIVHTAPLSALTAGELARKQSLIARFAERTLALPPLALLAPAGTGGGAG